MTANGEQIRLSLFRVFSANLARFRLELAGQYLCPLCLNPFPEEAVLGDAPMLTIEDCIPKRLGPRAYVLTCQTDNNMAGSVIDNQLHRRIEFEAFCKGTQKKPLLARVSHEGLDLGAEVMRTRKDGKPHIDIRIIKKQSHEEFLQLVQEVTTEDDKKGILPKDMKMQFGPAALPDNHKYLTAVLKAGYLLFFRTVGYGPTLSPHLDRVRKQIRDNGSNAVDVVSLVLRLQGPPPPTLCRMINAPPGIGVPVPFDDAPSIVILPSNEESYALWEAVCRDQLSSGHSWSSMNFTPLPYRVFPNLTEIDSSAT